MNMYCGVFMNIKIIIYEHVLWCVYEQQYNNIEHVLSCVYEQQYNNI